MLSLDAALRDRSNFSFVSGLARNRTVVLGETAVGLARGGPQLVGVADSAASIYSAIQCKNGSIAGGYQCPEPQTCIGPNGPGAAIECQ